MRYYKVYNTEDASEYYIVHARDGQKVTNDELLLAMEILGIDPDTFGIDTVELDMPEGFEMPEGYE